MKGPDYMTDLILHCLISLLNDNAVTDYPPRETIFKTLTDFTESEYIAHRMRLYGMGFSYSLRLDVLSHTIDRNPEIIKQNIRNHAYEIIILGSGHRTESLSYWDLVCKYYNPLEVGFIDGGDKYLSKELITKFHPCAAHFFYDTKKNKQTYM